MKKNISKIILICSCIFVLFVATCTLIASLFFAGSTNSISFDSEIHYLLEHEKPLDEILTEIGINPEKEPITSSRFRSIQKPNVKVLYQFTDAYQELGWYRNNDFNYILKPSSRKTTAYTFADKNEEFGLRLKSQFGGNFNWFSETIKNEDNQAHVKIYPMIENGIVKENSYVIAWEDWFHPDFNDLVIQLNGVELISDIQNN